MVNFLKLHEINSNAIIVFGIACNINQTLYDVRTYPANRCLDSSALLSVSFTELEIEDPSHLVAQCVNNMLVYAQYTDGVSYPIAIYKNNVDTCMYSGNYSNTMSCEWITPNPLLSLEFPDDRNPWLPSASSYYVIYEIFENSGQCQEGSQTGVFVGGTIMNQCYSSNDTFTMFEYDGMLMTEPAIIVVFIS